MHESWTDPITNLTTIRPKLFPENYKNWLSFGEAPSEVMSVFLHEGTHHICFNSPVGYALTLLALQIRRTAFACSLITDPEKKAKLEEKFFSDSIALDIAITYLHPLAEGLAAFAEFDAICKMDSKVISNLFGLTSLLYGRTDILTAKIDENIVSETGLTAAIISAISKFRITPETLARKSNLFLRPLSASSDGYLAGYLSVKNFHRSAAMSSNKVLNESDLFLLYIISFFYSDYGLVHAILNDQVSSPERIRLIIKRIADRIDMTMNITYDHILAFEHETSHSDTGSTDAFDQKTLHISNTEYQEGRDILKEVYADLFQDDPPDYFDGQRFQLFARQLLLRRQYLSFGVLDGITRVSKDGIASFEFDGEIIFETPCRENVIPGNGDGSAEIIAAVSQLDGLLTTIICRNGQVVAENIQGPNDMRSSAIERLHQMYMDRQTISRSEEIYAQAIAKISSSPPWNTRFQQERKQFISIIDELYKDPAMRFARDYNAIDTCSELMKNHGFQPLLGNVSLIQGAALIGLITSYVPIRDFVEYFFKQQGLSLDNTLTGLKASYDRYGYPPEIIATEKFIYSTI